MYKKEKKGVYYFSNNAPLVDLDSINFLVGECKKHNLLSSRLCLHKNIDSSLMSMLIVVVDKFVYPAHKHTFKDENYTVLKGSAVYEEYDEKGSRILSRKLSEGSSLLNNSKNFHTIKPLSNILAFIESTTGPFQRGNLEFLN